MKKIIVLILISLIVSLLTKIQLGDYFINTIYTVSGIMFSVGFGLIISNVNLGGVRNKNFVQKFRASVNAVRNSYIILFLLSTFTLVLERFLNSLKLDYLILYQFEKFDLAINFSLFTAIIIIYSIVYYITNFLSLQKINEKIFDEVNKKS